MKLINISKENLEELREISIDIEGRIIAALAEVTQSFLSHRKRT